MTSGTGRSSPFPPAGRAGFTLLEICFVLFIVALVFGAAVPALSGWLAEQRLRGPAGELELLARTARLAAMDRQRPCEVVLRHGLLRLVDPATEAAQEAEAAAKGNAAKELPPDPTLPRPYRFSPEITLLTRPWGAEAFANRPETRWRFLPNGLCEPLQVKFLQGASEIDLTFDPLTATVSDETYAFR